MTISGLRAAYRAARVSLAGRSVLSVGEVVGMIGGLEHAALGEVYAENSRGGEARSVVDAVARTLDVDIDAGPGHRWDADHMRRVTDAVTAMVRDRDYLAGTCSSLRDLLRKEKERADAAIAREEAADEAAEQFEAERDEAREQRDAWKTALEQMEAKRVLPLQRELREEREKNAELIAENRTARAAARRVVFHTTAADERRVAPGVVWRTLTTEEHTHTDEELQRLAESVAMRALLDSLVSDLKNTIVSQAREIARLKGESE
ncbi:hypothetical protein [Streptomyces sp. NRRL S-378]|uniref:hypothetical protein n=1 Tax=Streptomyces sp. NRRL S-378 TaxID=1463904 RepID=UPI0004C9B2BD|nr:hypothetical protein [Streptomyces sp. NRRL S-378]